MSDPTQEPNYYELFSESTAPSNETEAKPILMPVGEPANLPPVDPYDTLRMVYVASWDAYICRRGDATWDLRTTYSKRAWKAQEEILRTIPGNEDMTLARVSSVDFEPNATVTFSRPDGVFLNLWVPPRLKPSPAEWPRVRAVVAWLCNNDAQAMDWLINWMAYKIQNPGHFIGTSPILQGPEGSGKSTLARVLFHILGRENCAEIGEKDLTSGYNSSFAEKILVVANELLSDAKREVDVHNGIKPFITDGSVSVNEKFEKRREVKNRSGWIFTTNNDGILPLKKDNRRFAVLVNRTSATAPGTHPTDSDKTWREFLMELNDPNSRGRFTPEFMTEIAGFAYDMLHFPVNPKTLWNPHVTEEAQALYVMSEGLVEHFLRHMEDTSSPSMAVYGFLGLNETSGFESTVHEDVRHPFMHNARDLEGAQVEGTSFTCQALYTAFERFCRSQGYRNVPSQKHLLSKLDVYGFEQVRNHKSRGRRVPRAWDAKDAASDELKAAVKKSARA